MRDYVILIDEDSDLPLSYVKHNELTMMPMGYILDDKEFSGYDDPNGYPISEFYDKLRNGASPKTIAISPAYLKDTMERLVKEGKDVLYVAFSSGLSSTCNNAKLMAEEVMQDYPEAKVLVIDSLNASLGEGLLVNYAVTLKKEGKSILENAAALEAERDNFCSYFTVDDLHFLHKGGRVSKTTAVVGSVLGIKPILHVDEQGKLVAIGKVRGRKQSLDGLVKKMEEKFVPEKNKVVYISHGDCEDDAKYVADQVKKKFGMKSFLINFIGTSIGSHSGPGTVALFFVGNGKAEKN